MTNHPLWLIKICHECYNMVQLVLMPSVSGNPALPPGGNSNPEHSPSVISTKPSTSSNNLFAKQSIFIVQFVCNSATGRVMSHCCCCPSFPCIKIVFFNFLGRSSENNMVCLFWLEGPAKMPTVGFYLNSLIVNPYFVIQTACVFVICQKRLTNLG
jgi:hypothetical protein